MRSLIAFSIYFAASVSAYAQSASDYLRICPDDKMCEASRKDFQKWYPKAIARDYQGQRNVSFCLVNGCDGAVTTNRPLGCAWRLVIIHSGNPLADTTDTGFYDAYCRSRLSDIEARQMKAQAAQIFTSVYKRPAPSALRGD